jgi:two-component system phosphate regulon response regulator PhoB
LLAAQIHQPFIITKHSRNISLLKSNGNGGQANDSGRASGRHAIELMTASAEQFGPVAGTRGRIFLVEDETDIALLVRHNLEAAGFEVQAFASGAAVLMEALREQPSLFLLDVMLPGTNGFDLCRQIRATPDLARTPVIFLTAKTEEADRVKGLELGGDDYITKPFSPRELVARVRTVLRSQQEVLQPSEVLKVGDLEIDASSMTVRVGGRTVLTTVREFRLLEYFAIHRGRVFTRDQLLDSVWKETAFVTPRSVDVYVRRLREKIEADPRHPRYLKTLRGIGYRLENPK